MSPADRPWPRPRELPYKRYFQDPRALTALSIAVQELSGCPSALRFVEDDVEGAEGTSVLVSVICDDFPGENGTKAKASVDIEMAVDTVGNPVGPLAFEYHIP